MTTFKHKKGNHKSTPFRFKLYSKPEEIAMSFSFDYTCAYFHNDDDQFDWNKLTGISFGIDARNESVMIGWRYNRILNQFELAAYYHISDERLISNILLRVFADKEVKAMISVDYEQKMYTVEINAADSFNVVQQKFKHDRTLARRIHPWFGGNKTAPHDMTIKIQF